MMRYFEIMVVNHGSLETQNVMDRNPLELIMTKKLF